MFKEIMTAIGVGRRVVRTISDLKTDVDSFRPTNEKVGEQANQVEAKVEAMEKRISDLETIFQAQDGRLRQIERSLNDAVAATEAVAQRASTIFWVSAVGCALSVFAVGISITALALHR